MSNDLKKIYLGSVDMTKYMPCELTLGIKNPTEDVAVRGHVGKIIKDVYVNDVKKTTTVKFADGTTQTVTCSEGDTFDPVIGVAIAVSSYVFGSKKKFHEVVNRKVKSSAKSKQ